MTSTDPWGHWLDPVYFLISDHSTCSRSSMNDFQRIKWILQRDLKCFSSYKKFPVNSRPLNILTDYLNQYAVKILITEAATRMAMMDKLKRKSTEMSIECFCIFTSLPMIWAGMCILALCLIRMICIHLLPLGINSEHIWWLPPLENHPHGILPSRWLVDNKHNKKVDISSRQYTSSLLKSKMFLEGGVGRKD